MLLIIWPNPIVGVHFTYLGVILPIQVQIYLNHGAYSLMLVVFNHITGNY